MLTPYYSDDFVTIYHEYVGELLAERDRLREALTTIKKLTYDQPAGLFAEEALILHNIASDALTTASNQEGS